MMRTFWWRIRALLQRRALDERLDEEVQAHLEELAADYVRRGLTREQARLAARRTFGGVESMKEAHRDHRRLPWVDALRQDVVYAGRQLRHRPGPSIVAVLTLALSMATVIAVFTLVNGVVLKPLTYPGADRLVVAHSRLPQFGRVPVSDAQYDAWRRALRSIDGMALVWPYSVNLSGEGEPERVSAARVSPELFTILGAQPQLGRLLRADEDQPGRDRIVVISDGLWRRRFNADRTIVGRTISVNGEPYEVVGVLSADFRFPRISRLYSIPLDADRPEVWKPLGLAPSDPLKGLNFAAIARLSPGATLAQAQSELDALQRTVVPSTGAGGGNATIAGELRPLHEQIIAGSRRSLEVLLAAVAAVLLIACLNVTGVILSRSAARRRELAVRSAVGATHRRLARQLFTEGLVLSILSGGAAIAMAGLALRVMVLAAPAEIPRLDEVTLGSDGVLCAAILTLATTLIVGLLPAWRVPRLTVQESLKQGTRTTVGGRLPRVASTLVVGQLCTTAVCAIVASLLLQSLLALLAVNKGFDESNIITGDLELAGPAYAGRRVAFQRSLIEQLQAIQGVTAVALSSQRLLAGAGINLRIRAEGRSVPVLERPLANFRSVNPDFFRAFRIPMQSGQVFADPDPRPIAVISKATAERLWPGESAVGKRFRRGPDNSPPIEVVGVVADVRATNLEQPAGLVVFVPYWQSPPAQFSIAVQASGDVQTVALALREVVRRLDPSLPLARLQTMNDVVAQSVGERRFLTVLVMLFATIASLLAATGIYGVISQRVTQRTAEIGLRVACGAQRSDVMRMVLKDAWLLTAIGVTSAIPVALLSGSALRAILFEVTPSDGRTIAIICLVMAAVATAASYAPARRASRLDAMVALRAD